MSSTHAVQRLERAGAYVAAASSLPASAVKALVVAAGVESDRAASAVYESLMDSAVWTAARATLAGSADVAYVTEPVMASLGVLCAFAIGTVVCGDATPLTVRANLKNTVAAAAAFAAVIRRNMVNLESPYLRTIVASNASAAVDLVALLQSLRNKSASAELRRHVAVDGLDSITAAAEDLSAALFSHAVWAFAGEPNASAVTNPVGSVSLSMVETKKLPKGPTVAALHAANAAIGHNRPLPVKAAVFCTRQQQQPQAAVIGLHPCAKATYAFLSVVVSTASARAAVFYRFDDEMMLMNNTSATDCRVLLTVLQRTPFALAAKRKAGAPPLVLSKAVDGLCDCFDSMEAIFTAFVANGHWRTFAAEKRRLMLARAAARPDSTAAAAAIGADAGLKTAMLSPLEEREDALGRLSHGIAKIGSVDATSSDDAAWGGGSDTASQNGHSLDHDDDARSDAGQTDGGYTANTNGEQRSEGGYTHMSARTAATTTRGRAVIEAVKDLFLEPALQRRADAATNVHLPLVLLELFLGWTTKALKALDDEFKSNTDADAHVHYARAASSAWRCLSAWIATAAHADIFAPADDSRFNGGLGLAVLEKSVLAGVLLPALAFCTSGTLPTTPTVATAPLGLALCELAQRGGTHADVLRRACDALVVLDGAVPMAVQRHLPAVLAAFGGAVSSDPDTAKAVDASVVRVVRNLVQRLGTANQLGHFIKSVQSALLVATDTPTTTTVLAQVLLRSDTSSSSVLQDAVREAAAAALDAESLVAAVNAAITAAVATEEDDEDDEDDADAVKTSTVVGHRSKAALIGLCHWVLLGVSPSSLTALPLLEALVELDVVVATHTAGNVLTRIATADAAASEAQAAYDEKPSLKRLRPWLEACDAAVQERNAAGHWLRLLDAIRRLSATCAQDLGVSAPETFLQAMEESVWQYGTDLGTIVVAFSCEELEALLAVPDALTALPSADDVTDAVVQRRLADVNQAVAQARRTLSLLVASHVGQRLARGASLLGVLSLGVPLSDDDGARKYSVQALLSTSTDNVTAAKKMAKAIHRIVTDHVSGNDTTVAMSPDELREVYPASVAEIAAALHPAGAAALASALARNSAFESSGVVSSIADALCRRFVQITPDIVVAVKALWSATKKQLLSKAYDDALRIFAQSTAATSPSEAEFTAAVDTLQTAVAITTAMHSVHARRGALPGGLETTSAAFDLHREVLAECLSRPELLGQVAKPTSALSLVVRLISNVRRMSADALRFATSLQPQVVPKMVRRVMRRRREEDEEGDDGVFAPAQADPNQQDSSIVSDCVSTVSVDGDGTQEFVSALVAALTLGGATAGKWAADRTALASEVTLAVASASGDLLRTATEAGDAFYGSETTWRFLSLLDLLTAQPRFIKLGADRSARPPTSTNATTEETAAEGEKGKKRKPRAEASPAKEAAATRPPMCDLIDAVTALCGAVLQSSQAAASRPAVISLAARTLRHVIAHGLSSSDDVVVQTVKAAAGRLVSAGLMDVLASCQADRANECVSAAWALCAATDAAAPALVQIAGRGATEALVIGLNAIGDTQRVMQHASTATQQRAIKWISATAKAAGHAVARGDICTIAAAKVVYAYLTLPNVKVSPVRSLATDVICAALRSEDGDAVTAALDFCRLPLQSLHRDPSFVSLEMSLIAHALSLPTTHGGALAAACRVIVLMVTNHADTLQYAAAELPVVVRLLTRCTLQGLHTKTVDATAASLLGSTLYHLSRHKVLSMLGRTASPAFASAMAYAMFSETSKFLGTASSYSLELDTCGFDIITAAQERVDIVYGALKKDPQAQSLLRKAASRLAETKEDQVAVDAGMAMPGRSGPVAFAN